ncbi:hypothetical protein NDU88_006402 [Pleurodeles waltl]|uniref:Uncharacterized protein n=1 Tax=Pleurodeles waltl TaxID=8319 RepID=A0AAV7QHV0_PLEWA|nr:hypothetical protein NDU88_006402 [Pleurodeles waltl]
MWFLQLSLESNVTPSRQTDVPASLKTESGTESRFSFPSVALSGRHDNTDAACLTGNPDNRVPEALKVDDGLRAARVAAEGDAEGEKEKEKGRPEKSGRHPTTEELRESAVQDLAESVEVSEGRELCHVPRGTWLDQTHPYLRSSCFRYTWESHEEYLRRSRGTLGKKRQHSAESPQAIDL